jgi:hypothetical protein
MKTILPWLLVVIAAGGAVFLYNGNQTKTAELARLQAQVQELEPLHAEVEELKKNQVAPEELARLNEAKDEVLRLRNQVRLLTSEKTQLNQQAQAAQNAAQRAQADAQAAQAKVEEVATKMATERTAAIIAARQAAADPAVINVCLNQLRQLHAAKQQWAADHQKPATATPTDQDLVAYFGGQALPTCPGGGKYAFGNLTVLPGCSTPGHVLPPPQ